jgi:hypothetical protein
LGLKIWKGIKAIEIYGTRAAGGLAIMWNPQEVSIFYSEATSHIFFVPFQLVGTNVGGIMSNVYGP